MEGLRASLAPAFWSPDFQIDSSLFNTISVVRENIERMEGFLRQINTFVYFRINKNFTEFYKIVQKLNKFDSVAQVMVNDIAMIRGQFGTARMTVKSEIDFTQRKIRRKLMLKEVLKIFETMKYIDRANSTMKSLFEKTDFKKVSELLVVLKHGFDDKLRQIRIFENKFEEINSLKRSFIDSLVKMALGQIEGSVGVFLGQFKQYLADFDGTSVLALETSQTTLESVHSILIELRVVNEINLASEVSASFQEVFHQFNRDVLAEIKKRVVFNKPSLELLTSYKNLVKVVFMSYKFVFSFESEKEIVQAVSDILTKGTSAFFKKAFDVFDLFVLSRDDTLAFLELVNSFSGVFQAANDSVFWQLQLDFKKLILVAKQQSNFQTIKKAMEEELWSAVAIGEETEGVLRRLLRGLEFDLLSKYVRVGETKFVMTASFQVLLSYFHELILFQEQVGSIGSEFLTKVEQALKLYLFNSENLLLKAMAVKYNRIAKINTKMLGLLTSAVGTASAPPEPPDCQLHAGQRGGDAG